ETDQDSSASPRHPAEGALQQSVLVLAALMIRRILLKLLHYRRLMHQPDDQRPRQRMPVQTDRRATEPEHRRQPRPYRRDDLRDDRSCRLNEMDPRATAITQPAQPFVVVVDAVALVKGTNSVPGGALHQPG